MVFTGLVVGKNYTIIKLIFQVFRILSLVYSANSHISPQLRSMFYTSLCTVNLIYRYFLQLVKIMKNYTLKLI